MFVLQTLSAFMENPMGKGSNAIMSRRLIQQDLATRYKKNIVDAKKKVELTIYRDFYEYYFHFQIPSEGPSRQNTYDIILHFLLDEHTEKYKHDNTLNRYLVKFFSNNPSFVYTYAYAFNLYGLLVSGLNNKFDPETFKAPPVTRNPAEVVGYEKSLMFACEYLVQNPKMMNKIYINTVAKKFSMKEMALKVRHVEKIELEYKAETNRVKEAAKKVIRKPSSPLKKAATAVVAPARKIISSTPTKTGRVIKPKESIKPRGAVGPKKRT